MYRKGTESRSLKMLTMDISNSLKFVIDTLGENATIQHRVRVKAV